MLVSSEGLDAHVRTRLRAFDVEAAFEVSPGRCLALTGPSGAGKTTILRMVAGLTAAAGKISCGGSVWLDSAAGINLPAERRGAGFVFQDGALFPHLSAWRNVAYGAPAGRDRRAVALELLERFGIGSLADTRPSRLSGGECQRVALARALARSPSLLLLDEPLSALDARSRDDARGQLAELIAQLSVPVLLVTHDFVEASILGDEVAVIDQGVVVQRSTPEGLVARPESAFVAQLTGASVLPGVAVHASDGLTHVRLASGHTIVSPDQVEGIVSVILAPWDIVLSAGPHALSSAQNTITARVIAVSRIGPRVRVTLGTPDALTAEITAAAAERLNVEPGRELVAEFKATATRLVRGSA